MKSFCRRAVRQHVDRMISSRSNTIQVLYESDTCTQMGFRSSIDHIHAHHLSSHRQCCHCYACLRFDCQQSNQGSSKVTVKSCTCIVICHYGSEDVTSTLFTDPRQKLQMILSSNTTKMIYILSKKNVPTLASCKEAHHELIEMLPLKMGWKCCTQF